MTRDTQQQDGKFERAETAFAASLLRDPLCLWHHVHHCLAPPCSCLTNTLDCELVYRKRVSLYLQSLLMFTETGFGAECIYCLGCTVSMEVCDGIDGWRAYKCFDIVHKVLFAVYALLENQLLAAIALHCGMDMWGSRKGQWNWFCITDNYATRSNFYTFSTAVVPRPHEDRGVDRRQISETSATQERSEDHERRRWAAQILDSHDVC